MESSSADPLADLLYGELVRELRARALSESTRADALRNIDPISADALVLSAMRLRADANRIEWLAARYVQLGQQIEYWTNIAESPETYVKQVINGPSGSLDAHPLLGDSPYLFPRNRKIGRAGA